MDPYRTPPKWMKPKDVMRMRQIRLKKRSLDFRMTDQNSSTAKEETDVVKPNARKNPFKRFESTPDSSKKKKFEVDTVDDATNDGTLFRLLNFSQTQKQTTECQNVSFTNALSILNSPQSKKSCTFCDNPLTELPVDWTLRSGIRLVSSQPYPWNQKLKTCEEASGITGFVRCIDTDTDNERMNLDTSPNARFHQCCLVWQHPSLPWIDVYPRIGKKQSTAPALSTLQIKDTLYKKWLDSFRSLFQLIRAKQCPYFYVIANTFIVLFRAAGINGYTEMNACMSPTTRGFRQLLKDEDIEFTMPLKNRESKSPVTNDTSDTGYNSLDVDEDQFSPDQHDEEPDEWLHSMGVGEGIIRKINTSQREVTMDNEKSVDESPESLVFVEGVEAQALFNFLVNCKSIVSRTGYFAGVPPTLLSPVAFTGASLISLPVISNEFKQNGKLYHSLKITGPVLPHTVHNLCDLMKSFNLDNFSVVTTNIEHSKSFTSVTSHHLATTSSSSPVKTPRTPTIFGEQNLSDCGLKPKVLARFCKNVAMQYNSIKYEDSHYECSNID